MLGGRGTGEVLGKITKASWKKPGHTGPGYVRSGELLREAYSFTARENSHLGVINI